MHYLYYVIVLQPEPEWYICIAFPGGIEPPVEIPQLIRNAHCVSGRFKELSSYDIDLFRPRVITGVNDDRNLFAEM